jgi:hypothetical protein
LAQKFTPLSKTRRKSQTPFPKQGILGFYAPQTARRPFSVGLFISARDLFLRNDKRKEKGYDRILDVSDKKIFVCKQRSIYLYTSAERFGRLLTLLPLFRGFSCHTALHGFKGIWRKSNAFSFIKVF